jgi:hypothetical protein
MPSLTDQPEVAIDLSRCPLCGADNRCAMTTTLAQTPADNAVDCWCKVTTIAPEVLARVPAALCGKACLCARCARG